MTHANMLKEDREKVGITDRGGMDGRPPSDGFEGRGESGRLQHEHAYLATTDLFQEGGELLAEWLYNEVLNLVKILLDVYSGPSQRAQNHVHLNQFITPPFS